MGLITLSFKHHANLNSLYSGPGTMGDMCSWSDWALIYLTSAHIIILITIHSCDVSTHLCGEPCHLDGKNGCERACVQVHTVFLVFTLHLCKLSFLQPIDHTDGLHLCSARTHACGEPCHLSQIVQRDGQILCKSACVIDWWVSGAYWNVFLLPPTQSRCT